MIVNDLLRAWEEGMAAVAPVLSRRDEVSQAEFGQHATALRVKTHVRTGTTGLRILDGTVQGNGTWGTHAYSIGKGCADKVSWNKGCGGDRLTMGGCW